MNKINLADALTQFYRLLSKKDIEKFLRDNELIKANTIIKEEVLKPEPMTREEEIIALAKEAIKNYVSRKKK